MPVPVIVPRSRFASGFRAILPKRIWYFALCTLHFARAKPNRVEARLYFQFLCFETLFSTEDSSLSLEGHSFPAFQGPLAGDDEDDRPRPLAATHDPAGTESTRGEMNLESLARRVRTQR